MINLNKYRDITIPDYAESDPVTVNMKLNDIPYNQIADGKKTIELRLFDEKRQELRVGDYIRFTRKNHPDDSIITVITAFHRYPFFGEIFKTELYGKCGFGETPPDDAVSIMRSIYSETDEFKYGIVGIEIAVIR